MAKRISYLPSGTEIAVIGGIAGLSTALFLAGTASEVTVIESAPSPGSEASGATAGTPMPQHVKIIPALPLASATPSISETPRGGMRDRGPDSPGRAACGVATFRSPASRVAPLRRTSTAPVAGVDDADWFEGPALRGSRALAGRLRRWRRASAARGLGSHEPAADGSRPWSRGGQARQRGFPTAHPSPRSSLAGRLVASDFSRARFSARRLVLSRRTVDGRASGAMLGAKASSLCRCEHALGDARTRPACRRDRPRRHPYRRRSLAQAASRNGRTLILIGGGWQRSRRLFPAAQGLDHERSAAGDLKECVPPSRRPFAGIPPRPAAGPASRSRDGGCAALFLGRSARPRPRQHVSGRGARRLSSWG